MNKNQLNEVISDVSKLTEIDTTELNEVVREFPYFQTGQLLYAKKLILIHDMQFESQIKRASIAASNRQILFEYLYKIVPENPTVLSSTAKVNHPEEKATKKIDLIYTIPTETPAPELNTDILNEAIDASVELQSSQLRQEPFTSWLKKIRSTTPQFDNNRQHFMEMIEDFVRQEDHKIKTKAEFYSPENKAKQSVELNEDIITETLAKIFVKQKNYSKAIKAYDALSLKYPEKSAYFAAQIREVKQIINQNKVQ